MELKLRTEKKEKFFRASGKFCSFSAAAKKNDAGDEKKLIEQKTFVMANIALTLNDIQCALMLLNALPFFYKETFDKWTVMKTNAIIVARAENYSTRRIKSNVYVT